ncbi:LamG-like jellyroll fold domain-containing protein [Rubripirellula tenax]|nr:LamG-like jellyroll fold domain-containing protein [Rubripirellula tenax]
MSKPGFWASDRWSRQAKSQRRRTTSQQRRLRLFESLEQRIVFATLAWYPLDEVSGAVATDVSGNSNHGTVTGGAWADGQLGGSIDFNANGNISVPASTFATVDQQVTFSFWAYGGDTQPTNDSILYGVNSSGSRVLNVHLSFSNGRVYWDAGNDSGYDRINRAVTDPLIHKDSWHHWAFTKNATSGTMAIYLDGQLWASGTGNTKSMAGVTSFTLGSNTNGSEGYDGRLDDVRIFDNALTAAEVLALYTTTTAPNTEEVLATNSTLAANADATTVITSANLQATDAEQSASELTYTMTSLPVNGTIVHDGTVLAQYGTFTQADIDNSLVVYDHAGGSIADSFTFAVNDGLGSATTGTFNVLVANNGTVSSLADLRALGTTVDNTTVTLSTTGGDPHPVTGVVTPGHYWINGDHIANPTSSEPTFLELGGTNNTYIFTGTTINLDTRKLDGFGRALAHDSGIEVVKISGTGNTINDLNLMGHDLAMDTDPGAQRHADWAAVYVQMTGTDNTVDGAHVLTRGSSPYGYGDVFGKGARVNPQGWDPGPALDENGDPVGDGVGLPWHAHNKTSAFQVIDTVDAVINDMHLEVKTYGHGFFVQGTAQNTTLTNSTVTGELFSSNNVIATELYQAYGFTSHGNVLPPDMMISGNEDGVRMYTGPSGLTVDNVVVTNMRTGFSVALGRGTMNLNNVEAYGTENGFNFKSNTTITNAKGDITHGPLLHTPYDSASNTSVEVELVGGIPEGVDWSVAYVAGNNLDITINSSVPLGDLPEDSLVRLGQVFFDNWRDSKHPTGPDDHGDNNYDYINSTFINNTNQVTVLGISVTGNTGSSQGGVISNGKDNQYDGVTLVYSGDRLTVEHLNGMGNVGDATAGTYDSNGTIVFDGATLEVNPSLRITDERVTITGDGVNGKGAVYSDGSVDNNTRLVGAGNNDIIVLDGDASIGVGIAGNQLLVGRVSGTGNLTKLGAGNLSMERSSTFAGNLIVDEGGVIGRPSVVRNNLTVASGAWIGAIGNDMLNTPDGVVQLDGTLDMNRRADDNNITGKIGRLNGFGQITSSNSFAGSGGTLTITGDSGSGDFSGSINGNVSLVKSGNGTQSLGGTMIHTGTTTVSAGTMLVNGPHTGGGIYTVNGGGTLGGIGSIGSAVIVNSGGRLAPGESAGILTADSVTLSSGAFFDIEIGGTTAGSGYDRLLTSSATLGGTLNVSLIGSGGTTFAPSPADTFTVAVSSASMSGDFENVANGQRITTVGGEGTFLVTYDASSSTVVLSDYAVVSVASTIVNRGVAYRGASAIYGEGMVDPNKSALHGPGAAASMANYTNYSQGINRVVVDIDNLPASTLTESDFQFRVGNTEDFGNSLAWTSTSPSAINVAALAGTTKRVTIDWPHQTIMNQWLEVTVKANANTGLTQDDVFYFGNQVGDVDGSTSPSKHVTVNAFDTLDVRFHQSPSSNSVGIDNIYDIDRNGSVNAFDTLDVRFSQMPSGGLMMITLPPAAAPEATAAAPEAAPPAASSVAVQNPNNALDVNGDGQVTALDALIGINFLGQTAASSELWGFSERQSSAFFYDVSGDGRVTALDSLQIINKLGRSSSQQAEMSAIDQQDSLSDRDDELDWVSDRTLQQDSIFDLALSTWNKEK